MRKYGEALGANGPIQPKSATAAKFFLLERATAMTKLCCCAEVENLTSSLIASGKLSIQLGGLKGVLHS